LNKNSKNNASNLIRKIVMLLAVGIGDKLEGFLRGLREGPEKDPELF